MKTFFKPEPADSVGLITNYKCTFRCKHCLYCSSPEIRDETDEYILLKLTDEIGSVLKDVYLHIGGGEPLIHFDLIKKLIPRIKENSIFLEYMETNGFLLLKDTEEKLKDLKEAGLNQILLSITPFHNEFISVENIKRLIDKIVSVLGPDGIFPWHPGYFYFLERVAKEKPVRLEDYFGKFSLPEILYQLNSVIYLHPGGRAAYLFAGFMDLYPPESLLNIDCRQNLASPVHAHIDYQGNYITGFCSGLRIGEQTALKLKKLYSEGIEMSEYPVLRMLTQGGLKELYDFALRQGYIPRKEGYVAACHLCLDMRVYLYFNHEKYKELYPSFLYEELGGKETGHRLKKD